MIKERKRKIETRRIESNVVTGKFAANEYNSSMY